MKTIKVMSIIGLVMSCLTFMFLMEFDSVVDYEAAIGWGIILVLWTIAQSIVSLVISKKLNK